MQLGESRLGKFSFQMSLSRVMWDARLCPCIVTVVDYYRDTSQVENVLLEEDRAQLPGWSKTSCNKVFCLSL